MRGKYPVTVIHGVSHSSFLLQQHEKLPLDRFFSVAGMCVITVVHIFPLMKGCMFNCKIYYILYIAVYMQNSSLTSKMPVVYSDINDFTSQLEAKSI